MSQKGFVYILSNPSMPELVKIGKTTRDVERRATELYQTGVPTPFEVSEYVYSPNCAELEKWVHTQMAGERVSAGREFFKSTVNDAMKVLENCLYEQVAGFVSEFMPDHTMVWSPNYVCEGHLGFLADEVNAATYEVAQAMGELTGGDIRPALERHKVKVKKRKETMDATTAKLKVVGE